MILTGLGGGTPGGSTTQIQYNNVGVFGGSADLTLESDRLYVKRRLVVECTNTGGTDPAFYMTQTVVTPGTNAYGAGFEAYSDGANDNYIESIWGAWTFCLHAGGGQVGSFVSLYVYAPENYGSGTVDSANAIFISDMSGLTTSGACFAINYADKFTVDKNGRLTIPGGTLLTTNSALTDGSAAGLGTITNAPIAGNPTKWIPINDNGTTRYIPAW